MNRETGSTAVWWYDRDVETARLAEIGHLTISSRGTVFFCDGDERSGSHLRKLENGVVATLTDKLRSGKLVDGPLAEPRFNTHADGPARTHFSSNSGLTFATYDPVHRAIWLAVRTNSACGGCGRAMGS